MVEINFAVITCFAVGLFALSGFFRGWWKEAITTMFLAILVLLLARPDVAQTLIELINQVIAVIWSFINSTFPTIGLEISAGNVTIAGTGGAPQLEASNPNTWIIILIVFIAFAIILSRFLLSNVVRGPDGTAYSVRTSGGILGGVVGALNGFLIINLIREYLNGFNLPGGGTQAEIAQTVTGTAVARASSDVRFTTADVPDFSILDSFLPWILVGIGFFLFLAVLKNRVGLHSRAGFRRLNIKAPYGYRRVDYKS